MPTTRSPGTAAQQAAVLAGLVLLTMGASSPRRFTFHKDVEPILQARCQSCHRAGELAPMALMTYAQVRPWAKAIKAAVATRRMPPWFADPAVGCFSNDPRLGENEVRTVADWVNQGAPEGNVRDAPPAVAFQNGWTVQPDLIVEMPKPVTVPASGTVNYKYVLVKTSFASDLWVAASEMRAGNPKVLHHGKVWVRPPGSRWMEKAVPGESYEHETQGDWIGHNIVGDRNEIVGKFNPGLNPQRYDVEGAGIFIPKGSDLVFELHYTPAGVPATDASKLGLVLAKTRPNARYFYSIALANFALRIPPRVSSVEVVSEVTVEGPVKLAYVQPHMHLRGKDYELRLSYPDGRSETVFKGKYDFAWQLGYTLTKPIPLPQGTRITGVAHFDNSANNPFNPDPSQEVRWGAQNWDEMASGFLGLIVNGKTDPERVLRRTGPSAPTMLVKLLETIGMSAQ